MPERFAFSGLRELFAKANEEKSGDQLAGIAARSESERVAAKRRLADLTLDEIVRRPLIDPGEDDVSRLILDTFNQRGDREGGQETFAPIKSLTVGEFREFLLDDATTGADLQRLRWAILPEVAAAAAISGISARWTWRSCASVVASSRRYSRNSPTVMLWSGAKAARS